MIILNIITKTQTYRKEFLSVDLAQSYIDSNSDVMGFTCYQVSRKKLKKEKTKL